MDPAEYIRVGDEVSVMWRSTALTGFSGTVINISPGEYGTRVFAICRQGANLANDGAAAVPESHAVFSVRRGDSWVDVPLPLLSEEATQKTRRSVENERKRIRKAAPLFADLIEPKSVDAKQWIANHQASSAENLEAQHLQAQRANQLRGEVELIIDREEFLDLCARRDRYPRDPVYGVHFWTHQRDFIVAHGTPEKIVTLPPIHDRLSLDWLKEDATLTWATAPGGAQRVKVLWVGSKTVLCQLAGEPSQDFDPRIFPASKIVWLNPEDFAEFGASDVG